jgi:hypothetical protein
MIPHQRGRVIPSFLRIASCRPVLLFGFSMVISEPDSIGSGIRSGNGGEAMRRLIRRAAVWLLPHLC